MKLIIYQAECGDATIIVFKGVDNKLHHILIDMGFERTYRQVLQQEIKAMAESGNGIDLCIISHIHDDHIGGAIAYVREIQSGIITDIVQKWLYNPPRGRNHKERSRKEISSAKSIAQGDVLASYLITKDKLLPKDITTDCFDNLFGLKLTFLSPSLQALDALRIKYPEGGKNKFEREEITEISLAKANVKNDYDIALKDFILDNTGEDSSVENGSSIAVLAEFDGTKFLCLSDAHPTIIACSLKNMGYSKSNPLICDWIKVSHHGSKSNNLPFLYDMIQCNNFIISANGDNKYKFPSKQCLATIIRSSQRTDAVCNIHFTYDNETLRNIFRIDGGAIFEEYNFKIHFSSGLYFSFGKE